MNKEQIIKQLRDMAKHPTVTLPRDCEALKAAADLLAQPEQEPNVATSYTSQERVDKTAKQRHEQEPVAFRTVSRITKAVGYWPDRVPDYIDANSWEITPLYTTPPQRTWVGLTEEDKQKAFDDTQEGGGFWEFADAIEAKLKEKNT